MFGPKEQKEYVIIGKAIEACTGELIGKHIVPQKRVALDILRKFLMHYYTALCVYDVCGNEAEADHGSINVISRSAHESYLIYYWIFESCDGFPFKTEYRLLLWELTGISWRKKLRITQKCYDENRRSDEVAFDRKIKSLFANHIYLALDENEKKKCIKTIKNASKIYSRPPWKMLLIESGVSKYFSQTYTYLCDYAHCGSISAIQTRESAYQSDSKRLCHATLTLNAVIASKFILSICSLFPDAGNLLRNLPEINELVSFYAKLGALTPEDLDGHQTNE